MDKFITYGSVKNKIVASALLEERANRDFELEGGSIFKHLDYFNNYDHYVQFDRFMQSDPVLRNSHSFYDMTREE